MEEAHVLHAVWAIGPGQGACPPAGRHAGGAPPERTGLALCALCNVPGGGEDVFVKNRSFTLTIQGKNKRYQIKIM
jgi:hypothetical protein